MKIIICSLAIILSIICEAQYFEIPYGTTPAIDGVLSETEWDDAECAIINVQANWPVTVYYKHNDSALFFCYSGLVGMFGQRYPDVMLDINNDKSADWMPDDWWLHASYNDCEGNGIYNDWTSCIPSHPGWTANNFPLSEPGIVEMGISYSKIGLSFMCEDTLGISFEVSDTYTDYHYYPVNATIGNPSTWANGILSASTSVTDNPVQEYEPQVFPNPSSSFTTIHFSNPGNEICSLSVYNATGQLVQKIENQTGSEVIVEYKNQYALRGLYFFQLQIRNRIAGKGKFIIE